MDLNTKIATNDDKSRILKAKEWCDRWDNRINGFFYSDEIISINGIHLCIMCPDTSLVEEVKEALREGYATRDVVSHSVLIYPYSWEI